MWHRNHSDIFPRQKIYLSSLTQLIQKKITLQPEVEVNKKLFPQRNFAKKLGITHQRNKNNLQVRSEKYDLHWTSKKKEQVMLIDNKRGTTSLPSQRINHHASISQHKSTQLKSHPLALSARPLTQQAFSSTLPPPALSKEKNQEYEEERLDSRQKSFLRKGSNLQKQIVMNLLRSKLLK